MSKLDELVQELCPNGVEYKTIEDICSLCAGGDIPKNRFSREKTDQYTIPIYSNGIGENALYGYTDIAKIKSPCVTVSARGTIGYAELKKRFLSNCKTDLYHAQRKNIGRLLEVLY